MEGQIQMWKWEAENDAKGVVVIAHNILEHTGRYAYVITMLRRNGYHVIMGDLPVKVKLQELIKDKSKLSNDSPKFARLVKDS